MSRPPPTEQKERSRSRHPPWSEKHGREPSGRSDPCPDLTTTVQIRRLLCPPAEAAELPGAVDHHNRLKSLDPGIADHHTRLKNPGATSQNRLAAPKPTPPRRTPNRERERGNPSRESQSSI